MMKVPPDNIPRRCYIDLQTPVERAIYDAIQVVEAAGADPLLTDAVILLGQAKDKVSDYIDKRLTIEEVNNET